MTTKNITVQGVVVEVSAPYAEGQTITAAEAKALNQTRAENVRNNCAKQIKELLEGANGDVEAVAKQAQALVSEYDKSYEFTLASVGGGRPKLDPLEKEAYGIARDFLVSKIKEAGMTLKAYTEKNGEEAVKAKIEELAEHPEIVKAAKKALADRQKMADALGGI